MANSYVQSKKKKSNEIFPLTEKKGVRIESCDSVCTVAVVQTANKCGFHKLRKICNYFPHPSAVSQVIKMENSNFKGYFNF